MLKLREWNEVLDYADQIEEELISNGYNVKLHEYSMYDGRKGIYLTLYDNHNKVHQQYASGVHNSVKEYIPHSPTSLSIVYSIQHGQADYKTILIFLHSGRIPVVFIVNWAYNQLIPSIDRDRNSFAPAGVFALVNRW